MPTMKPPKRFQPHTVLIGVLAALALVGNSHAETALYSDDFSGDGSTQLNGTKPGTTMAGNSWIAHENWKADGSIAPATSSFWDHSAFLPFVPESGKIYTLSATLDQPVGSGPSPWAAIGFTNDILGTATGNNLESFWDGTNSASPWMLYRAAPSNGSTVSTFTGPGVTGGAATTNYSGPQTLSIVLDTTAAPWTVEWFVGTTSVRTHTYTTGNPTISYVGLGREDGAGVNFASFELSVPGDPRIASFSPAGDGLWELALDASPSTTFEFRSSTTLEFNPGTLVQNLTQDGVSEPAGTISGDNAEFVTTDFRGNARIRLPLAGDPADFVRAVAVT